MFAPRLGSWHRSGSSEDIERGSRVLRCPFSGRATRSATLRVVHKLFTPRRSCYFTDFDSRPLDFRHPPRRYSIHPCSTEGANRWRLLAEQGAAPAGPVYATGSPGASGDIARPNYVGPSGNGLVGADESGGNPVESRVFANGRPCPSPEGGPEDEGKTPRWSAERRAGPRYGPAIPSADGMG
jgi:hypothetical protein